MKMLNIAANGLLTEEHLVNEQQEIKQWVGVKVGIEENEKAK